MNIRDRKIKRLLSSLHEGRIGGREEVAQLVSNKLVPDLSVLVNPEGGELISLLKEDHEEIDTIRAAGG